MMRTVLDNASEYYHNCASIKPTQHCIIFPAQHICITYNKHPVVAYLGVFLQETERKLTREEYFEYRMGIIPKAIKQIDTYALSRVLARTKSHRNFYFKIMHKELNTMTVNHRWKLGESTCPFCHGVQEDWKHIIHCAKPARKELKKNAY